MAEPTETAPGKAQASSSPEATSTQPVATTDTSDAVAAPTASPATVEAPATASLVAPESKPDVTPTEGTDAKPQTESAAASQATPSSDPETRPTQTAEVPEPTTAPQVVSDAPKAAPSTETEATTASKPEPSQAPEPTSAPSVPASTSETPVEPTATKAEPAQAVPEPTAAPEPAPAPTQALEVPPAAEPTATSPTAVPEPTPVAEPAPTPAQAPQVTPAVLTAEAEPTAVPVPQPAQAIPEPGPTMTAAPEATTTASAAAPAVVAEPAGKANEVVVSKEAVANDESPEPQNKLTERFTQAEWRALKTFREQIPETLAEAYPEKADAKTTAFKIWGVTIDPTNLKSDARVSVILMKFLRARNLSPSAAREMLVNTLRWRESFDIEAALKEEFPEEVFGKLAHIYGKDKEGRPVVYNLYGANPDIKSVFSDVQRFIRWRVALQERSVEQLDFIETDQLIQIHDYAGVGLSSRDANSKAAASESTNIFGSHYPELLYKKFFINVPTFLNWIFWLFKPIIPAATLAKMSVVGTSKSSQSQALLPFIAADNLPERYGGEAKAF